jgi:hypothetical protein
MKTTAKIGKACLVGGLAGGAAIALLPWNYAWLGILIAFAVGYLAYEFREVMEAIPKVWQEVSGRAKSDKAKETYRWLLTSPCSHLGLLIGAAALLAIYQEYGLSWWMLLVLLFSYAAANLVIIFMVWLPGIIAWNEMARRLEKPHQKLSMQQATSLISYRNFAWLVWQHFRFPIVAPIMFSKFLWEVFKLIHSDKRTLCAFNSALATTTFYVFFWSKNIPTGEHIAFVLSCALFAAVLGVLEWKLFGKKLAKLKPQLSW